MKARLFQRKWKRSAVTLGTAVVSAAVAYGIWSQPTAILGVLMLVSHEYGHYFAGHFSGSEVSPPFFVPLGFMTVGATRIKNISKDAAAKIAMSGAIYGTLSATLAAMILFILGLGHLIPGIAVLIAYEIGWGIVGGDGSKYRAAKRGM